MPQKRMQNVCVLPNNKALALAVLFSTNVRAPSHTTRAKTKMALHSSEREGRRHVWYVLHGHHLEACAM